MVRAPVTRRFLAVLATLAASALPAAGASGAVLPAKAHGPLSPALAALAKPSVQALPAARRARLLGVAASGPGSLIRKGGRVLVDLRFDTAALAAVPLLDRIGALTVAASRRYQTVTARVSPSDLRELADLPGVVSVTPVRHPVVRAVDCKGGSVISEGVGQLNVEAAREAFAVRGEGLTVGVLSDSFDQATEAVTGGPLAADAGKDEETADLPGPENECAGQEEAVNVLRPFEPGPETGEEEPFDEGRAMLQIVHDVAPQANLAFDSAFNGELDFAEGIEDLAKATPQGAGAKVIADDVAYFEEPFFQDGPVAAAVDKVAAKGVTYLSAAGNDNLFDGEGHEIASWEAPSYRDSGDCPAEVRGLSGFNAHHCMDFNPGAGIDRTFGIRVEPEEVLSIDLQWAEPWFGVKTDLDAFLLDAEGRLLTASFEGNITETKEPVEIVQWENTSAATKTVQLAINRFSGSANPRLKFILLQNGAGVSGVEYPKSGGGDVVGPALYGHAGAAGAIAVGAAPFDEDNAPEEYSSRGPVTHYFGPVKSNVPATALSEPEILSKPDVLATDCGQTTFFARQPKLEPTVWRFCGTSAAAPHAAGIASLMLQAEPGASPDQVEEAMAGSAIPVGSFGSCAVGGGLLDALTATEAVRGELPVTQPEPCEPPAAGGAVFLAPGNWGLEEPPLPASQPAPSTPPSTQPVPPVTRILQHPKRLLRIRSAAARVVFRFGSDQPGSTFLCRLDRGPFRSCGARLVRRLKPGRHVLKVEARNPGGQIDPTAAVFRFRIERV